MCAKCSIVVSICHGIDCRYTPTLLSLEKHFKITSSFLASKSMGKSKVSRWYVALLSLIAVCLRSVLITSCPLSNHLRQSVKLLCKLLLSNNVRNPTKSLCVIDEMSQDSEAVALLVLKSN